VNVLDLFSGIGGFSLGLERAGMRTVAFCEVEPFCRWWLAKQWPGRPIYGDIRELSAQHLTADRVSVDVICGGFPCQDISSAGPKLGIDGARSGLWKEYARLIGEVRPRYVIVENVADLRIRGLERVLGDLAALGYDAEWDCVPACAVGAPHERDRLWLVAYAEREGLPGGFFQRAGEAAIEFAAHSRGRFGYPVGAAWDGEPELALLVHGLPDELAAAHALGNAVVPQIPEIIGRAIMKTAPSQPKPGAEQSAREE
jgi:DNA (cytosine-5)-methyltransferase 1